MKSISFDLAISLITVILICLIVLPILSMFTATSVAELIHQCTLPAVWSAIITSLETSLGEVGHFLNQHGCMFIFSKKGIITAQLFVSAPFLIKSAREAFESIDENIIKEEIKGTQGGN